MQASLQSRARHCGCATSVGRVGDTSRAALAIVALGQRRTMDTKVGLGHDDGRQCDGTGETSKQPATARDRRG